MVIPAAARADGIVAVYSSGGVVVVTGGGNGVTAIAPCEDIAALPSEETDWSATGSGDWFDAGNWSNGVPGSGTTLIAVKSGGTATINSAAANAGASLDVCSGTVDLQAGGSLETAGILIGDGGTLQLSGSVSVSGQIDLDGGVLRSDVSGSLSNLFELVETTTSTISVAPDSTLSLTGAFSSLGTDAKIVFGSDTDTGVIDFSPSGIMAPTNVAPAGGIEIAGGTLRAGNNALGSLYISYIAVDAGATLDFNDQEPPSGNVVLNLLGAGNVVTGSSSTTLLILGAANFSGNISGAGKLDVRSVCFSASNFCTSGLVELSGTNAYLGTTTISNGTLQIDAGGSITGTSNVIVDLGGNFTIDGAYKGGGISIRSGGLMTVNGSVTSGTTVQSGGSLNVSSNGTLDASGGLVVDGNANIEGSVTSEFESIQVGSGGHLTVDGTTNTQGLQLEGSGGTTINGSSTSSGGVVVDTGSILTVSSGGSLISPLDVLISGTLTANGTVTSTNGLTVYAGGTLSGTGTVSSTQITSGGIVAPGSAGIGMLHVNGNLSIAQGGFYDAEISSGTSDEISITGQANIAGTLNLELLSAPVIGTKYTLLTAAGGVIGEFAAFAPTPLGKYRPTLNYDTHNVMLEYELATLSPNLPDSATSNETAVANGIDNAIDPGTPLPDAFQALSDLSSADLATATTQLSGEVAADLPQIEAISVDPFLNVLVDTSGNRGEDLNGPGRFRRRHNAVSAWVSGYGEHSSISGDTSGIGSHSVSGSSIGAAAGLDVDVVRGLVAGVAVGYGHSTFSLGDDLGSGSGNDLQFGVHALADLGRHVYFSAGGVYALQDITTRRTIALPAAATLDAKITAHDLAARLEAGYRLLLSGSSGFTPFVAAQRSSFDVPRYSETGSPDYALAYDADNATTTRVELGAALDDDVRITYNTNLYLYGRAAFAHGFESSQNAHAAFGSLPGSDFIVKGAAPGSNAALFALDAEFKGHNGFSLGFEGDGSLSQNSQSYYATADLSYSF